MGTVHVAFDRLAQRSVAYKRLRVDDEAKRGRIASLFLREYDTLKRLTHPNIVQAYDFGFDEGGPFYTMELLSGNDLASISPLPVREACRLIRDIASALALLHARRLVHRDVTLGNVRRTNDGRTKLIDFGALTPFGVASEIVGTAPFVAPECFACEALDHRTDLFGLGALAYWVLTKRSHTSARTMRERKELLSEPVVAPSRFAPDVPKALDELVLALLQPSRRARPESAAEVIDRLTALADLPPEAEEERVAHSYLQHGPLRGREKEVAGLRHALTECLSGHGQVVWLEADQGLGRTALLDHAAVEAQMAGATVLRAPGGVRAGSFGTARYVAETVFGIFPELARELHGNSSRPANTRRPRQGSTIDASELRQSIGSGLATVVMELSRRGPLVLLVDDAHAVDGDSLSLFASLVDARAAHPILLVLTTLSGQPAQDANAERRLRKHAKLFRLAPLDEEQVRELVATTFGEVRNSRSFATWLFRQAGGNPGHSIDLARLLLFQGAIRYTVGTFTLPLKPKAPPASQNQSASLLASLAGLSPEAHTVARLLSSHAGALSIEQMAHASALRPQAVVLALEELTHRGAVHGTGEGFSCTSERLREALRESTSPEESRAIHLALAAMFGEQDQSRLENRLATAHHLLESGGDHAFDGARGLAQIGEELQVELAALGAAAVPLLEKGLSVLEARGLPDEECVALLVPLTLNGFFGQLDVQRRYLERTMRVLASLCGIARAQRLRPSVGAKLALLLGVASAFAVHLLTRRAINHRAFSLHFMAFCALPGAAAAAYASVWDARECERVASWLEPFAAASEHSLPACLRQVCMATAEIGFGQISSALERFTRMVRTFEQPVRGLTPHFRQQLHAGCLVGRAQALATDTAPAALPAAEELERSGAYFATHAESVRTIYYAYRGQMLKAEQHRERAETLALRGGALGSPLALLAVRWVLASVMTGDIVRLVHALADFERFARLSPSFSALYDLAGAHLDQLRGQPQQALSVYDRLLSTEAARTMPTYSSERSLHAQALNATGDFAAAKALCLNLLEEMSASGRDSDIGFVLVHQQLALAQSGLGELADAARLVDGCFARAGRYDNPLWVGIMHRTRAHIAALSHDGPTFREHFLAFELSFRSTGNPVLVQQTDALRARAINGGLLDPTGLGPIVADTDTWAPNGENEQSAETRLLTDLKTSVR